MKIKSKSLISIILSIMMVISMILVAIPANAAVVDNVSVGAGDYYLWYGFNDDLSTWESVRMIQSGSSYVATTDSGSRYTWTYFFITNGNSKDSTESVCWPTSTSRTLNKDALSAKDVRAEYKDNLQSYNAYQIQVNAANLTYSFSYNGSDTVTVSEASSTPTTNHTVSTGAETHGKFTVSPTSAAQGDTVTVTTTPDSGYEVDTVTYTPKDGSVTTISGSNNIYTFTMPASDVTVNVTFKESVPPAELESVTLTANPAEVTVGDSITLTATVAPSDLSGVTYTFYRSTDNSETTKDDDVEIDTGTNNVATITASETTGTYYYYVVATHTTGQKTSTPVPVKVTNEGEVIKNVTIRFKGTTLSSLIPYMSVDGETATEMTRSTANPIGTHLSGAYRFVWFEATIPTVTVGQSKTLTFTTKQSKESTMNASITLDFNTLDENVIYIAVDNLMSGTTAVDITDNDTAKTSFGSAMNMIKQSSAVDPVATTLLSTMLKVTSASGQVTTKRYYLGDLDSDKIIGIKDATEIQKSIAGSSDLGAEYQSLGDFNADGVVDIKDATAIQKYIAGI